MRRDLTHASLRTGHPTEAVMSHYAGPLPVGNDNMLLFEFLVLGHADFLTMFFFTV